MTYYITLSASDVSSFASKNDLALFFADAFGVAATRVRVDSVTCSGELISTKLRLASLLN